MNHSYREVREPAVVVDCKLVLISLDYYKICIEVSFWKAMSYLVPLLIEFRKFRNH